MSTKEQHRLSDCLDDAISWRRWGPYLSDRAWATVREDYSPGGDAWGYLPHDKARSKAYRWGEDGIAGISDRYQFLCFAPAFWNEKDPILKERLFGLTPHEGNHGEDVKEYYFHVDNTPTHSYMKLLYKYPQEAYPYGQVIEENKGRNGQGYEFELLDTGIFDSNRYFDIFIEYAKVDEEDIFIRITAHNRGPAAAPLHILPQLWFRNIWAWTPEAWEKRDEVKEPVLYPGPVNGGGFISIVADDESLQLPTVIPPRARLGKRYLYGPAGAELLFTDNETNGEAVYGRGAPNRKGPSACVKDAFHRYVIKGEKCLSPTSAGTKSALHYRFDVPAGGSATLTLRLSDKGGLLDPLNEAPDVIRQRKEEADEFYNSIHKPGASEDERRVQRQAYAGLLWTKQSYLFDVHAWLEGDSKDWPPPDSHKHIRNVHWRHLNSMRVMTMPDKWEYPWFAAWDLAFHCVAFASIDPKFAKEQLWILLFEQFQHPNGQIPAYEWEYSDLNPPVHAWAVWRVFNMEREAEKKRTGNYVVRGDRDFLEKCFHKLLINFAWWINKVDRAGNNVFEGGFLGLDNITVVDRSEPLPGGAVLEQADATGWMGMFCLNLMRIALELAKENPVYEGTATKFFQHYCYVAKAMKQMGNRNYQLWDHEDGFFYDVLRYPNGEFHKFRVRSLVGLIPLFAVERLEVDWIQRFPEFTGAFNWFIKNRPDLCEEVVHALPNKEQPSVYILTIVNQDQMTRMLQRMWDESEFLSDYGIRSLSKAHEQHPYRFGDKVVGYEPAEAISKIKGGNSNWRGPIWFPTSFLIIESLRKLGKAYGPQFSVKTPGSGGQPLTFRDMGKQIADRMIRIFTRQNGKRAVYGGCRKFQEDEYWKDYLQFYEYFHGDNGAGLGASHQTGWTGLVASLIDEWRK
jgi:hypothetical protein